VNHFIVKHTIKNIGNLIKGITIPLFYNLESPVIPWTVDSSSWHHPCFWKVCYLKEASHFPSIVSIGSGVERRKKSLFT
jgi:hypothetical protein